MFKFVSFLLFVFILSPLINAQVTLDENFLSSHGINPYTRYDKDNHLLKIRVHVGDWSANAVINRMAVLLLRDALGYEVEPVNECRNSTCIFNSIRENNFDVALGVLKDDLQAYDDLIYGGGGSLLGLSTYGEMGGVYFPEFLAAGLIAERVGNSDNPMGLSIDFQDGILYKHAGVINFAFPINPSNFTLSNDALIAELQEMMDGDVTQPDSRFIPEWCLEQKCIEIIGHNEDIHTNVLPAFIRNTQQRMQIAYWGTKRANKIMQYMTAAGVPFLVHYWDPEYFSQSLVRVHFTSPTRVCWESHSMMNSDGLDSSVDCDFFPFETIGVAGGEVVSSMGFQDALDTLSYIDLDRDTMLNLTYQMEGNTDEAVVDNIVKEWLEANPERWVEWVQLRPGWNRYEFYDDGFYTFIFGCIGYSIMSILLIVILIWHYIYRKHPAVKRKTTKLVYPWLLGQLICCITWMVYFMDQISIIPCAVVIFGLNIGVTLWILSPALRAYRMARIFNEDMVEVVITNWDLLKYLFMFTFVEGLVCGAMVYLYATNEPKTMADSDWPEQTTDRYLYYVCFCRNNIYRILWYCLSVAKLIYLCVLLILARRTKNVWQTHRETFELTLQGYTSILFCFAMFVLKYMETPWQYRISIGAGLVWMAFASCLYFYMYKLIVAVHLTDDDEDNETLDDDMFKDMKRSIQHMDVKMLEEIVSYLSKIIEVKMLDSTIQDGKSLRNLRREISDLAPRSHILTREHSESKSGTYRSFGRYTDDSQLSLPRHPGSSPDDGRQGERIESPRRPKRGPGIQALSPISEIGGVQIEMNPIPHTSNPTEGEEVPADNYNDPRIVK